MKFGAIAIADAEGAILAHTQRFEGGTIKKGRRLGPDEIARLRAAGVTEVVAARLEPGDVPEDEAATRVATAACGTGITVGEGKTGRTNLYAERRGLLCVDRARIDAVNRVHESVTIATVPAYAVVDEGDMVATVKTIPFAVDAAVVDGCEALCTDGAPLLEVAPFASRRAGLVLTRLPGVADGQLDRAAASQRARLAFLGSKLVREDRCAHSAEAVAAALVSMRDEGLSPLMVLGASAIVDRRDVVPQAIERAGGEVVHLGMPVDPGNLLLLGRLGEVPVVGVPGCARSTQVSGFDWVLQRLCAGLPVGREQVMAMGTGGLLEEVGTRPLPRGAYQSGIVATVLAAGRSARMGAINKMLAEVEGTPMVVHAVEAMLGSRADETVVVTGHQAAAVRDALRGYDVRFVHNPDYADGMSTSVRAAVGAAGKAAGVVIALGDMPDVTHAHVDRLIDAFAPDRGHSVVVPTFEGSRGNPVVWGSAHFSAMKKLRGDRGARSLIEARTEQTRFVEMDGPGVLRDYDTPEALRGRSSSDVR